MSEKVERQRWQRQPLTPDIESLVTILREKCSAKYKYTMM